MSSQKLRHKFSNESAPAEVINEYKRTIDAILGGDFDVAATEITQMALDMTQTYATDPNVYSAISMGVVQLSQHGDRRAYKIGENILDSMHIRTPANF